MLFSIITVTMNDCPRLMNTLRSVDEQTCTDLEHIVVDGCSTDGTPELLASRNVRVVSREPRGVYDAINGGLDEAQGEIIGLLNGGDKLASPDVLQTIADAFAADPELDFVFGDVNYYNPDGRIVRYYSAEGYEPRMLREGFTPPHPSLFIRREAMHRIGHYKADYVVAADFDMFARLFKDKTLKFTYLPLLTTSMATGGISTRWYNRLFVNNREKLRALRENGIPGNFLTILARYRYIIRDLFHK